jgi:DNA repair exonuclease SbcCD ATPase subunit
MFYGAGRTKAESLDQNDRMKYAPWQGGRFGGSLVFFARGKTYRIERFFGAKQSGGGDTFALFDTETNLSSADFSDRIGEELFGINADSFERTLYLPQKSLSQKSDADLALRLTNLVHNTDDAQSYTHAAERLKADERLLMTTGGRGSVYDAERRVNEGERAVISCRTARESLARTEKELNDLRENATRTEQETDGIKKALYAMEYASKDAVAERKKNELKSETAVEGQIKNEPLSENETTETKKRRSLFDTQRALRYERFLSILAAVFFAAAFMSGTAAGAFDAYCTLFIILGGLCSAGFAALLVRRKRKGADTPQAAIEAEISELRKKSGEAETRLRGLLKEVAEAERKRGALSEESERLFFAEAALESAREEYAAAKHEREILRKTQEFLTAAKERLSAEYILPLTEGFKGYLDTLGGRGGYALDTALRLKATEQGQWRDAEYYSTGTRALTDLALRFAFLDRLFRKEAPFVILDDPFSDLDDEKLKEAKALLIRLAKDRQIIYFTCHTSRAFKVES